MPWNRHERLALVDALTAAGPGVPTVCAGWNTEHLAAHVVLRETAPLVAAGIGVPALAARTERSTQDLGDRSADPDGYASLVARVRTGPPFWYPMRWLGDAGNLLELLVHTEDVRRGGPDGRAVPPRDLPAGLEDAAWRWLVRTAPLMYRESPVDVVLTDGRREHLVRSRRAPSAGARGARPGVTVRGPVSELVLHAFDRARVAHVTVEGRAADVAALEAIRPR